MKRNSLLLLFFLLSGLTVFSQTNMTERFIWGTGGTITDTLDNGTIITLDLSTDDVEQENNEVDSRFDDDLDAGWEGDPADQNILSLGLRFQNLPLIQGSIIDSAFIEFHAHEGKTAADVAILTIQGEDIDNSQTFDSANFNDSYLLEDRNLTSASVTWTVAEDWVIWQPYRTSDISSIVKEIVDRPGWTSGNAMSFMLFGEDQGPSTVENAREFTSFENIADPDDQDPQGNPGDGTNHPEWRPKLIVYVNGPLGTEEFVIKPLSIYPNPVNTGMLRVELSDDNPATLTLMNTIGQVVKTLNTNGDKAEIEVNELSRGIYILNVNQGGKSFSQKVVIE